MQPDCEDLNRFSEDDCALQLMSRQSAACLRGTSPFSPADWDAAGMLSEPEVVRNPQGVVLVDGGPVQSCGFATALAEIDGFKTRLRGGDQCPGWVRPPWAFASSNQTIATWCAKAIGPESYHHI